MTSGVTLTTHPAIWEVSDGGIEAYNVVNWEPRTIDGVTDVVFASGGVANVELLEPLENEASTVHVIGDCFQPRDIEMAIIDGHRMGREI